MTPNVERSAEVEFDRASHTLTAFWGYDSGGLRYRGPQDDDALRTWASDQLYEIEPRHESFANAHVIWIEPEEDDA